MNWRGPFALRATAQVGEGVGDGGKGTAADLPGGPGEEQGVPAGLGDEAEAVGLGGGVESGVVAGDVGEGLQGGGLVELLEFEPSAGGDDEGAAGEEGFAGAREVTEEGKEAALVGVGKGFEVVEDEEGAGAGEGVEHLGQGHGKNLLFQSAWPLAVWLRCSSVTDRSGYAPSSRLARRPNSCASYEQEILAAPHPLTAKGLSSCGPCGSMVVCLAERKTMSS